MARSHRLFLGERIVFWCLGLGRDQFGAFYSRTTAATSSSSTAAQRTDWCSFRVLHIRGVHLGRLCQPTGTKLVDFGHRISRAISGPVLDIRHSTGGNCVRHHGSGHCLGPPASRRTTEAIARPAWTSWGITVGPNRIRVHFGGNSRNLGNNPQINPSSRRECRQTKPLKMSYFLPLFIITISLPFLPFGLGSHLFSAIFASPNPFTNPRGKESTKLFYSFPRLERKAGR